MNRNREIAEEILRQLGGNLFVAMTGAKDLMAIDDGLMFSLPRGFAKNSINKVRIVLTPMDTYTVEFWKIGTAPRYTQTQISKHDDIYVEDLRRVISDETGLALSLENKLPHGGRLEPTPGPWENNGGQIEGPGGYPNVVAVVGKPNHQTPRDTANARIIAVSPRMLELLKLAYSELDNYYLMSREGNVKGKSALVGPILQTIREAEFGKAHMRNTHTLADTIARQMAIAAGNHS